MDLLRFPPVVVVIYEREKVGVYWTMKLNIAEVRSDGGNCAIYIYVYLRDEVEVMENMPCA